MEILKFLNKSMQERFIAAKTVEALEKELSEIIEAKVKKMYLEKRLIRDNLLFELIDVTSRYGSYTDEFSYRDKINIKLHYLCISKLPKDKQLKVDEARIKYDKDKHFGWNNLKVQLWYELNYELEIENCLSDKINLDIS